MHLIDKLFELVPIEKKHWPPIILALLLAESIGGWLFIQSLYTRIENLKTSQSSFQQQFELSVQISKQYEKYLLEQLKDTEEKTRVRVQAEFYKDLYLSTTKTQKLVE